MTAAITRYGITRARSGTSLGAAGRLLTLLLVCVLGVHAHTLIICCATAPTHQHATSAGIAEPPHTDSTGAAGADGITPRCSDHEQHGDTCDIAATPVRITAHTLDATILAVLPHGELARSHTPDLTRTVSVGGRATGTDLISLRI